eukprot:746400-Rhodomonas_salina.3
MPVPGIAVWRYRRWRRKGVGAYLVCVSGLLFHYRHCRFQRFVPGSSIPRSVPQRGGRYKTLRVGQYKTRRGRVVG